MTDASRAAASASSSGALDDNAAHLLVVDDDSRIRTLLSRYLVSCGYRVTTAADARCARLCMEAIAFDLIVLDAMMPGETGFELARKLREDSDIPILMLTARAETTDRVRGLEAGADDYLTKPFEPKELALRIASILRRATPRIKTAREPQTVRFGDFVFSLERAELRQKGVIVHLTDRERAMLRLLAQTPGEIVTREALAGQGTAGNDRTVDVQINRLRRKIESDPASPLLLQPREAWDTGWRRMAEWRRRRIAGVGSGDGAMSATFVFPGYLQRPRAAWKQFSRSLSSLAPKGLYARSLLIVIVPMVMLQSVIAYSFMERHWQLVTRQLSNAVVQDVAALVDMYQTFPNDPGHRQLERIAADRLGLDVEILPGGTLPPALPKPFFSILDGALSRALAEQVGRPFWIDTVGRSDLIEIRVQLDHAVLRVLAHRSAAYASNSHIFLLWMIAAALILLVVAILFLRNQIRPILHLAGAAEAFGKGREVEYRPRGAREVRQAGYAFIEMKRRIERTIEQRTTMLNGVSHDLRTILTRFKLSLVLLGEGAEFDAMQKDVEEMQRMLEAYLAFARGDGGECAAPTDIRALLNELKGEAERHGHATRVEMAGAPVATVRPDAFKRCLANLVNNAQRYGGRLAIEAASDARFLTIHVDDDGPGVPPEKREDVFRPFFRLDEARNQDEVGTGLGLAIARDIARAHGGDVQLSASPLGGLRASVRVPV